MCIMRYQRAPKIVIAGPPQTTAFAYVPPHLEYMCVLASWWWVQRDADNSDPRRLCFPDSRSCLRTPCAPRPSSTAVRCVAFEPGPRPLSPCSRLSSRRLQTPPSSPTLSLQCAAQRLASSSASPTRVCCRAQLPPPMAHDSHFVPAGGGIRPELEHKVWEWSYTTSDDADPSQNMYTYGIGERSSPCSPVQGLLQTASASTYPTLLPKAR